MKACRKERSEPKKKKEKRKNKEENVVVVVVEEETGWNQKTGVLSEEREKKEEK